MHELVSGQAYLLDHVFDRLCVSKHLELREDFFIREEILALAHVHAFYSFKCFSGVFLDDSFYVSFGEFWARKVFLLQQVEDDVSYVGCFLVLNRFLDFSLGQPGFQDALTQEGLDGFKKEVGPEVASGQFLVDLACGGATDDVVILVRHHVDRIVVGIVFGDQLVDFHFFDADTMVFSLERAELAGLALGVL